MTEMMEHSFFGKVSQDEFGHTMKKAFDKIQACTKCECSKKDCNTFMFTPGCGKVPFSFNKGSIMLVGESPYSRRIESPLALIPFCLDWDLQKNKSGEILKTVIEENGLDIKNFCSSNLVKCSVFSDEEFEQAYNNCKFFFEDQVRSVEPLLIVGLGERVRKALHGKMNGFTEYTTNLGYKYKMICIKHPAWVLRDRHENMIVYRSQFKIVADWIKTHTARQHALVDFGFERSKKEDGKTESESIGV